MSSDAGDWTCLQPGFPIRKSSDHSLVIDSPRLIADSYVLHRFLVPRHPPCALKNLTTKMLASTMQFSTHQPTPHHTRRSTPHAAMTGPHTQETHHHTPRTTPEEHTALHRSPKTRTRPIPQTPNSAPPAPNPQQDTRFPHPHPHNRDKSRTHIAHHKPDATD